VGLGDLAPTTDASKLFTIGYLIGAVSIIGTFLSVRFRTHSLVHAASSETGATRSSTGGKPDALYVQTGLMTFVAFSRSRRPPI
jgi:hypothetical protein